MPERGRLLRAAILLALGAFVILTWLPRAWAARWIADDWCFAVSSVRDGFWRSQALVYNSAAGRFTVAFLYAVFTRLGSGAARWLSMGAMAVWLVAAWRVARSRLTGLEAIAAAVGFVGAVLNAAPDTYQPLIWTGGLFTYGVPVIGATIIAAVLPHSALLAAAIAFVTGGSSEVAAVAQIVFACAFAFLFPKYRRAFIAIAIASLVALVIVAIAPGNFQRRTLFHPLPIPEAMTTAIVKTPATFGAILVEGSTMFVPLIVFLALCGDGRPRPSRRAGALAATLLLASIAVVAATLFGGLVGTGRLPWGRVQFVPVAYVTIALVFVALSLRLPNYATIAMIVFAIIGVAGTWAMRMQAIRDSQEFARAADRVEQTHSLAHAPRSFEYLDYVSRDPNHWTNRCMAEYFR